MVKNDASAKKTTSKEVCVSSATWRFPGGNAILITSRNCWRF
jgi:hypothetical protein